MFQLDTTVEVARFLVETPHPRSKDPSQAWRPMRRAPRQLQPGQRLDLPGSDSIIVV